MSDHPLGDAAPANVPYVIMESDSALHKGAVLDSDQFTENATTRKVSVTALPGPVPIGDTTPAAGTFSTVNAPGLVADEDGNVLAGLDNLVHDSTDGFLRVPLVTAAPDGTPSAAAGFIPVVYCTADDKLYVYATTWKKSAAFT